ncbi:MAG TPA: hypothetical protein VMI94_13760 [Bryobacteraceae bacterium]|nr:hypothetical protein [Bryobacteraceae bacterium]
MTKAERESKIRHIHQCLNIAERDYPEATSRELQSAIEDLEDVYLDLLVSAIWKRIDRSLGAVLYTILAVFAAMVFLSLAGGLALYVWDFIKWVWHVL